jgi:hypothetical protein
VQDGGAAQAGVVASGEPAADLPGGGVMSRLPTLLAFWRIPYSASTWRRFAYVLVALPLAILSLPLAAAGQAEVAARYQRRLARGLVGTLAEEPPRRPTDPTVVALAAAVMLVGVVCWLLLWRFTYAVLALPLVVNFLALALLGRAPAVARYRQRLARRLAGPAGEPAPGRTGQRVAAHALASLVIGFVGLMLLNYLAFFTLADLVFPVAAHYVALGPDPSYGGPPLPWDLWLGIHRVSYHGSFWGSTYYTENGGPTLAGTWAYHTAQQFVMIFPLLAWAIRGVTRLQGWLTQALLGSPQPARR